MSEFDDDMTPEEPPEDLFGDLEVSWLRESDLVDDWSTPPPPTPDPLPETISSEDRNQESRVVPETEPSREPVPEPTPTPEPAPPPGTTTFGNPPSYSDAKLPEAAESDPSAAAAPDAVAYELPVVEAPSHEPRPDFEAPSYEPPVVEAPSHEHESTFELRPTVSEAPQAFVPAPVPEPWPDVEPSPEPDPLAWRENSPNLEFAEEAATYPAPEFDAPIVEEPIFEAPVDEAHVYAPLTTEHVAPISEEPAVARARAQSPQPPRRSSPRRTAPSRHHGHRGRSVIALAAITVALGAALSLTLILLIAGATLVIQRALG